MEIISGRKTSTRKKNTPISPMVDLGKLQPQARDLEEAVLGALMLEKDAYSIISDILKPECFYEYKHQLIYTARLRRTFLPDMISILGDILRPPISNFMPASSPRNIWRGN